MAKRALVGFSTELLEDRLLLPPGTHICGAQWDIETRSVVLEVEHEAFADVPQAQMAPFVRYAARWEV